MGADHLSIQEETIHRYLDNELTPVEKEAFLGHLEQCPACQAQLVRLETLFAELASLEEVLPPVDVTPQVMAGLPSIDSARRYAWIGRLALASQIAIGLVLILVAWPMINTAVNSQVIWQAWLEIANVIQSLNSWATDFVVTANSWIATQWPPNLGLAEYNIAPGLAVFLIAGLSLGWLIGNGVLLRHNPSSPNNGGTS
ncbi:MAG: zf-HC2 domain-containing protein [Anaerolineae bacterium]|jgi:anti-sigma factor RsiW|nr:zf-HC2 domain-containing protein [Anaerolineae bacterium]